ncbi:PREDICTED: zinc finger protein CONSTANS-LIKE 16-like isoform X2 [Lupinus angustifolius]|uniref:zinc finger protein CONSTANS-LIKE 16-like isoform X2 n=1 Tax=Lupinus angustifolius TaxID=3871 RepID=UPI00092ED399|nr:PREDICTED: zinc finger protein CONSTANS-LIKE 16-like isoform X2 [Lupinus angustifolius]
MSSTSTKNVPNPVNGKTARACDNCITKRARWYCAADDAFLCQACDSSVHSANPLARRHERLRLNTASFKSSNELNNYAPPSWHHKKARTPRHGNQHSKHSSKNINNSFHLVPEVGSDEVNYNDENEEQLLFRVPIFEPLCSTPSSITSHEIVEKSKVPVESLHGGFVPSDIELYDFAADVESLLGQGLENECIGMEELGLVDIKEESLECSVGSGGKKVMFDEEASHEMENKMMMIEMERESFEFSYDYGSHEKVKEKLDLDVVKDVEDGGEVKENDEGKRKKILLQLDYEGVISAWDSQKCPWTTGDKPNLDPDECWPQCMGTCGKELHYPHGRFGCNPVVADGGREARVSRYREKRRTRLFSKKIRYEVRKLNAEKRPRMKGRFVKRASFVAPTFPHC